MIVHVALAGCVLLAAWWLTGQIYRYALQRQLLDVPNARSSHAVPTPRGGGVAIAAAVLAALPVLGTLGALPWREVAAFGGAGLAVALVGVVDDHASVAARWRLLGHFFAAAWMLVLLGGLPPLLVFGRTLDLGLLGHVLAALYIVWMINLTNFMDGIDGIAAVETISIAAAGAGLYLVARAPAAPWPVAIVLAAATCGFLLWNWPPAKIFMGDAGSGFLGVMLAALSIQAAWLGPRLFWGWVILAGVFVVDATVTLLRRLARGERVYEAHRSHAYQHAAARRRAHKPITLTVGAINVGWLLPLAWLVAAGVLDGATGVVVAYAPLIAAAIWLDAGQAATT